MSTILIDSVKKYIKEIIKCLSKKCDLKSLRDINQHLGTEINNTPEGYTLNQNLKSEE